MCHILKSNFAIFPNRIMPNCGTNYRQTAEQNFAKLRKSFKNICTCQLFLLPLQRFSKNNKLWKAINHVLQISY